MSETFRRSLKLWFGIFFLMSLVNWHDGGPNAASRFAAIQAMTENHSFEITPFKEWTIDWAQTPDGRVFSNKAPAPMLIAVPVAWLMNRAKSLILHKPDITFVEPAVGYRTLICWIFQILPFGLLVWFCARWLSESGASLAAVNFTVLALLFGSTLSFMLDVYFGHAVSACALLAMMLCFVKKHDRAVGFFFGLSMLSDYGTIFLIPAFLIMLAWDRPRSPLRLFIDLCLGAAVPVAVWIWYHTVCFGKPWALPMQFQNPLFVEEAGRARPEIWGVANPFPDGIILLKLCFGQRRGILFTQPWVWVSAAAMGWIGIQHKQRVGREIQALAIFAFGGLAGLLWMNAGFNGWHGGGSPGPRYLSIIFPMIAVLTGFFFDRVGRWMKALLWVTLGISIVYRLIAYSVEGFAPAEDKVWPYVIHSLFHNRLPIRGFATLIFLLGYFVWAGISIYRPFHRPFT